MRIKKKELFAAVSLGFIIVFLVYLFNMTNQKQYAPYYGDLSTLSERDFDVKGYSSQETQQRYQVITETIEGELERGAFEAVVNHLVILAESNGGYVKSLRMTYVDGFWSGQMTCKLPPENVMNFTFKAREIIDENGTVTYINISIEEIESQQQTQEPTYSTIYVNLKEKKPQSENGIAASMTPVVEILSRGLLLIAQGVVIGLPICFASLGVVLLVSRGLLPIWKSLLKKPKVAAAAAD